MRCSDSPYASMIASSTNAVSYGAAWSTASSPSCAGASEGGRPTGQAAARWPKVAAQPRGVRSPIRRCGWVATRSEHVFQIVEGRHVDERAALHERIEQGRARAPSKLPAKSQFFRPSATPRSWFSAPLLSMREAAVLDEALERVPLIRQIPDRLAERRLRQHGRGERVRSVWIFASTGRLAPGDGADGPRPTGPCTARST